MKLQKFSLADLRAAWGSPPAIVRKPPRIRTGRKLPVDFGPQNCNLLEVWDFHQKRNYRHEASLAVNWLHRRYKEMGRHVQIVKRRYYETGIEPRHGARMTRSVEVGEASVARVQLWERADGWWEAVPEGKSSPILRPVPGNTQPASGAVWRTREAACAELPVLLNTRVAVVRFIWRDGRQEFQS